VRGHMSSQGVGLLSQVNALARFLEMLPHLSSYRRHQSPLLRLILVLPNQKRFFRTSSKKTTSAESIRFKKSTTPTCRRPPKETTITTFPSGS